MCREKAGLHPEELRRMHQQEKEDANPINKKAPVTVAVKFNDRRSAE